MSLGGGFHGKWPRKPNPKPSVIQTPKNTPLGPLPAPNRPQGASPDVISVPQNVPQGPGSTVIVPGSPSNAVPGAGQPSFAAPDTDMGTVKFPPLKGKLQVRAPAAPAAAKKEEIPPGLIRTTASRVRRFLRGFTGKAIPLPKKTRVAVVGWAGDSGVGRELVDACRNLPCISSAFILENHMKPTRRELLGKTPFLTSKGSDREMNAFLDSYKPDTILTWETPGSWTFPEIWRKRGLKWVHVIHWDWFNPSHMEAWKYATLVAPNRMCQEELKKIGLGSTLLPVPIDTERLKFVPRKKANVFVSVYGYGGIYDRRSMPELLEAWRLIRAAPRLIILAQKDPPEMIDLEPVPRLELCVGNLPEPVDLYAIGDVAIQPSRYEGVGVSMLEAQSCGMPVIALDAPPMNEVVRDLLLPVESVIEVEAMGKRLPTHVASAQAIASMAERLRGTDILGLSMSARAMVEKEYSWNVLRARWTEMFERDDAWVTGRSPKSDPAISTPWPSPPPSPLATSPVKPAFPTKASGHEILKMDPQAMWVGAMYGYSGYAKANREIVKRAMAAVRLQMAPDAPWDAGEKNPENIRLYETLKKGAVNPSAPQITFLQPRIETRPGYRVIYTMMETEIVHEDMIRTMNEQYHECWTPTQWNAEAFRKSGLKIPVCIMPLGIDPEIYRPEGQAMIPKALRLTGETAGNYETPEGFLFIYVCEPTFRKGIEIVIEAFGKAFTPNSDAGLLIASTAYSAKLFQPERIDGPKVWLLNKPLSEVELASVYRGCRVYVCASRGEGWNLTMCESAGCGLPVIIPRNSAHPEIVPPDQGYFFSPDHWHAFETAKDVCRWFDGIEFPDYGEKAQRELALTMRTVKHHYHDAQDRASRLTETMRSKYTWGLAAQRVVERIKELCSQ